MTISGLSLGIHFQVIGRCTIRSKRRETSGIDCSAFEACLTVISESVKMVMSFPMTMGSNVTRLSTTAVSSRKYADWMACDFVLNARATLPIIRSFCRRIEE